MLCFDPHGEGCLCAFSFTSGALLSYRLTNLDNSLHFRWVDTALLGFGLGDFASTIDTWTSVSPVVFKIRMSEHTLPHDSEGCAVALPNPGLSTKEHSLTPQRGMNSGWWLSSERSAQISIGFNVLSFWPYAAMVVGGKLAFDRNSAATPSP